MSSQLLLESFDPDATRQLLAAKRRSLPTEQAKRPTRREALPERIDCYEIQAHLGQGAFGKVYLALDERLKKPVAVKIFQRRAATGELDNQEYLAEASIAAKLNHPNIVPVYDVGRTDAGECYIVSKFIEGVDLDALANAGGLSVRESARIVAVIADALGYAHRQDVIHRDVKPANILLDLEMTPFITDFGVATEARYAVHAGQHIAGTPLYMSPEQIECASYLLDGRSDVFSVGVVLYQMLTGVLPFAASSLDDLKRQVAEVTPVAPNQRNASVPDRLARICMRAMAKTRAERYETAGQFASVLIEWLEQPCDGLCTGDSFIPVSTTANSYLINCPQCGLMIPKDDSCANCHWSENAETARESKQKMVRSFAARRRIHVRNYAIFMALEFAAGLVGLITALLLVMVFYLRNIGLVLVGCSLAATGILGAIAACARKLFPIDLNCPACEIRLDELGTGGNLCPNCDAQLE